MAAYLSTASKLGGVVASCWWRRQAVRPWLDVAGPALAVLAVLTMTVGNLVALRQRRMVRLLAWSSVAQAGYILAPLGRVRAGRRPVAPPRCRSCVAATVAYTVFFVLLELAAFARGRRAPAVIGTAARSPTTAAPAGAPRGWPARSLLALAGLAGLPPGLAGLFAKVTVVRALLAGGSGWLAVVVALNAVVGLAYYMRVVATLFAFAPADARTAASAERPRVPWAVAVGLAVVTVAGLVVGLAPQLVLDAANAGPVRSPLTGDSQRPLGKRMTCTVLLNGVRSSPKESPCTGTTTASRPQPSLACSPH